MVSTRAFHFGQPAQWALAAVAPVARRLSIDTDQSTPLGTVNAETFRHMVCLSYDRLLIMDGIGQLHLVEIGQGQRLHAGPKFVDPRKMICSGNRLFVVDGACPTRIFELDAETFQMGDVRPYEQLIDVAADATSLWVLRETGLFRQDHCATEEVRVDVDLGEAQSLSSSGQHLAALDSSKPELIILDCGSGSTRRIGLTDFLPVGVAGGQLALTACGVQFLIYWTSALGSSEVEGLLTLDPEGNLLGTISFSGSRLPLAVGGSAAGLVFLLKAGAGLTVARESTGMSRGAERHLLPVLDLPGQGLEWLCADLGATLPTNATLSMRWATTAEADLKIAVNHALKDQGLPVSQRLGIVDSLLADRWSPPVVFTGEGAGPTDRFRLPLHEARERWLWVDIEVKANRSASRPEMGEIAVRYGDGGLMNHLPAIYRMDSNLRQGRRTAFDGSTRPLVDNSLRNLVAVLEATTDGIDLQIGRLADRLNPARCADDWLGALAAMLGLPFHDALSEKMKRAMLTVAGELISKRGTRSGLVIMLGALLPGRKIRVRDRTGDLEPVTLGGSKAGGTALPALLSGPSRHVPKLNARLIVGRTPLCQTSPCQPDQLAPSPQVLVEIEASDVEQRNYSGPINEMIAQMVPADVLPVVRWLPIGRSTHSLDDDGVRLVRGGPAGLGGGYHLGAVSLAPSHKPGTILDNGQGPVRKLG